MEIEVISKVVDGFVYVGRVVKVVYRRAIQVVAVDAEAEDVVVL